MKELIIPYGTTEINDLNDNECEKIIIPSTVKTISNSFNNMSNLKEVVFQTEVNDNEEVIGITTISKSFNNTSISKLDFPISMEDINDSFRNNSLLQSINFRYSQKDNKIKGIEKIRLESFNNIPIKSIVIPPSIRTIDSSFKDCSNLRTIDFKTAVDDKGNEIGIKKLTNNSFYNIPTTNINIPRTLKLNTSQLPIHSVKFSRGSYPMRKENKKIQSVFVPRSTKIEQKENNTPLYDYVNGFISINENGKTNEINVDKTISYHDYSSALKLILKNFNIHVSNNQNNPFILAVTAANNNLLTIQIQGNNAAFYFPENLTQVQYESLMRILNRMKQKEMTKKNSFKLSIFYNDIIYDKSINGDIKLEDIKPFIKENLINNTHKL